MVLHLIKALRVCSAHNVNVTSAVMMSVVWALLLKPKKPKKTRNKEIIVKRWNEKIRKRRIIKKLLHCRSQIN